MIIWKKAYFGKDIVEFGMYENNPAFNIFLDRSTGFTILQGMEKFVTHYSKHIDLEGAKKKAEEIIEWRKK